jgi:spore coat protein U-like protein
MHEFKIRRGTVLALAGLGALAASSLEVQNVLAATTANLTVSAEVTASCDVFPSALEFGDVQPSQGKTTEFVMIQVQCSGLTNARLQLGGGQHHLEEPFEGQRKMKSNGNVLVYELEFSPGAVWTIDGHFDLLTDAEGFVEFPVRGVVGTQTAQPGSYQDLILMTVSLAP